MSLTPMTTRMSCSISRIGMPSSSRMLQIRVRHLRGLVRVHARRRLVEQQQRGLDSRGRGRSPGAAGRRRAGSWPPCRRWPASPTSAAARPLARATCFLLRGCGPVLRKASMSVGLMRECMPDQHVLEGRHVREQADVLECAADARRDHLVGSCAAEDAEPESAARKYQRGRTIATSSDTISECDRHHADDARSGPSPIDQSRRVTPGCQTERRTGTNQTNGSAHARTGLPIIRASGEADRPSVGSMIPTIMLKNVVLPAPFGPMMLTIAPRGIVEVDIDGPRPGRRTAS